MAIKLILKGKLIVKIPCLEPNTTIKSFMLGGNGSGSTSSDTKSDVDCPAPVTLEDVSKVKKVFLTISCLIN